MAFQAVSTVASPRGGAIRSFLRDIMGYGAASAVALFVDCGLLALFVRCGVQYQISAALSFLAGLGVAYVLNSAFVFKGRARYGVGGEFVGFLITGLMGLVVNQLLLYIFVDGFGAPIMWAKAPTAVLTFAFNFFTRRFFLFLPGVTGNGGEQGAAGVFPGKARTDFP